MASQPFDYGDYVIETGHDDTRLWQRLGGPDAVTRIIDTAEEQARKALIEMGWTPPATDSAVKLALAHLDTALKVSPVSRREVLAAYAALIRDR